MTKLRIGLAGAGWAAEHHLSAYAKLSLRAEIAAIADPDRERCDRLAEKWGIAGRFASAEDMVGGAGLDAVDVAAPREHHAAIVRCAAGAGLAVFCQKPLAPTYDEAVELVESLPADHRLMVHENWRYRPHYATIRDWIAEGRIGRLRGVFLSAVTSGLLSDSEGRLPTIERQPMLVGLDRMLLMEVMIHHVDALRSLVGDMKLRGAVLGSDSDCLRGEDRATLLMEAAGTPVALRGDFRTYGAPPGLSDRLDIQGTEGAILLDGDSLSVLKGQGVSETLSLDLAAHYADAYRLAIEAFLDAVSADDRARFHDQVADNLKTLDLVERAYAAGGFTPRP